MDIHSIGFPNLRGCQKKSWVIVVVEKTLQISDIIKVLGKFFEGDNNWVAVGWQNLWRCSRGNLDGPEMFGIMIGNVVNVAVAANRIQVVVLVELGTTENTDIETLQVFPRSDNPSEISCLLRFLFDERSALFHELTCQAIGDVLLECNQISAQGRVVV